MTEQIIRVCDCNACAAPLSDDPVGSERAPGAYCSRRCADHAGRPLRVAEAEHREEDGHGDPR